MIIFYNLGISLYFLLILIASLFSSKAKLWLKGRKNLFEKLAKDFEGNTDSVLWIHAASLGEFEQGRPIIESYKKKFPDHKILLTFFSPSGYEIRKDYTLADYIYYLPLDTKRNAKKFIQITKPQKVVFVKYEFWYHYIYQLQKNNIPVFFISAIFRKNQIFFRWYGQWYKKLLKKIDAIFVQNETSLNILKDNSFTNIELAGDTRFDRVSKVAQNPDNIEIVEKFISNSDITIIGGSTWSQEEETLADYYEQNPNLKIIIAPHEIHQSNIDRIENLFNNKAVCFTKTSIDDIANYNILIIDTIGMLSSIYQYAQVAVIGGGFGKGIHNILEAATFGLPIVFGPNHTKFNEAIELLKLGGAFSYKNDEVFNKILTSLVENKKHLNSVSEIAKSYISTNTGATEKIINKLSIVND